jgi:hypothetical protein
LYSWIANWTSAGFSPHGGVRDRGLRGDFCDCCLLVSRQAVRSHEESERLPGVTLAMKTSRLEQLCEVCGAAKELELDACYVPVHLGGTWWIQRLVHETNPQLLGPERSDEIGAHIQRTAPAAKRLAMLTSLGFRINDQLTDWIQWQQRVLWWLLIKGVVASFAAVLLLGVRSGVVIGMMLVMAGVVVVHRQFRRNVRTKIWPRFQMFLTATEMEAQSVAAFFEERSEALPLASREFQRYMRPSEGRTQEVMSSHKTLRSGIDFFRPNL